MNFWQKMITSCLLVVGIVVILLSSTHGSRVSQEKLYVGVLMPFSKDFAWWGDAIRNSIHVAQSDGYGREIEFVYEDTQCNAKDAVSGTQSLKARYPQMHMFMVGCDGDLKAMIPLLNKDTDLAFVNGLSGSDLYQSSFPIINMAYRLETEAKIAAEFAVQELKVKKLAIIVDNTNFGGVLSDSASAYMSQVGGTTVVEHLKFNDPNPQTSVLKVLAMNPDAVYIQNDIPTIVAILKRLDQFGYTGKRIVYYGGRDQSMIDAAGQSAEGVYVPWAISDASNPIRAKFIESFVKEYKKEPFITAYFTYDGVMVLDKAERTCKQDVRCIENYFYNDNKTEGTLGISQYHPLGHIDRSFYIQQVRGGKFVEVNRR